MNEIGKQLTEDLQDVATKMVRDILIPKVMKELGFDSGMKKGEMIVISTPQRPGKSTLHKMWLEWRGQQKPDDKLVGTGLGEIWIDDIGLPVDYMIHAPSTLYQVVDGKEQAIGTTKTLHYNILKHKDVTA